jgi:lipid-A-disaccharide synthase
MKLAFVAGEKSGDMIAATVLAAIRHLRPKVSTYGVGGSAMQEQGFNALESSDALAVRGYVEVLSSYPRLARLRSRLTKQFVQDPPDLFVGVDAPDFNLELERRVRAKGVRTAHFISPSVWAWRGERIEKIREAAGHVLVLFPFEQDLYRKARVASTFVGHPLADMIEPGLTMAPARQRLGVDQQRMVFCVMPGSRLSEITYNGVCFLKTILQLHKLRHNSIFLVPAANAVIKERLERLVQGVIGKENKSRVDLRIVDGQSHDCIQASNGVVVASGTATLEVALFGKPMVIAYRMNALSYSIMKPMAYLPYIGLPNILCGEFIVPEYVQGNAKPEVMAESLLRQVDDNAHLQRLQERFGQLHMELRKQCGLRAAEVLLELAGDKAMMNRPR